MTLAVPSAVGRISSFWTRPAPITKVCSAAPGAAPKASGFTAATVPISVADWAQAAPFPIGARPTPMPPEIKPTPSSHSRLIMVPLPVPSAPRLEAPAGGHRHSEVVVAVVPQVRIVDQILDLLGEAPGLRERNRVHRVELENVVLPAGTVIARGVRGIVPPGLVAHRQPRQPVVRQKRQRRAVGLI